MATDALSSEASSHHPSDDEENELMATDVESAPVADPPRAPVLESQGHEENPSPPPSALMSQAGGLSPSPTMGLMTKPTVSTNLPESSAIRDDEERVDYEGSSIGDAADEDRDDEDADVGNKPCDDAEDEEHDSMDDITTLDDAPKAPSDKASGYTPFYLTGSPPPRTTTATPPTEQQITHVSTPLQEQHLPGSSMAAVSPATLPGAITVTPPPEQP
ncbi:lateral signaling target protein 2 homolog [Asparagus officinalis]|uniref:lateral signaling target protein 2 homolog n=1 Tax=Asparagus officinalis TaxID=4686 RepID=UPI00098E423C|nr:lateral signaling target protein 2 homolog [Asparagus officinalis]